MFHYDRLRAAHWQLHRDITNLLYYSQLCNIMTFSTLRVVQPLLKFSSLLKETPYYLAMVLLLLFETKLYVA